MLHSVYSISSKTRSLAVTLGLLFLVFMCGSTSAVAKTLPGLTAGPLVQERKIDHVNEQAYRTVNGTTHRVWVYFRDKGVRNQGEFSRAASQIRLTEKASNRRSKVGLDQPLFLDLPVLESYVQSVLTTGATLRQRSRWLNAVSVDVTGEAALTAIMALPCVANITSVVGFRGNKDIQENASTDFRPENIARSTALNYGSSLAQLDQLKVPVAHALGYNAQGVFLALFDSGFRTGHEAFATAISEGRLIAQHDFVFGDGVVDNQPADNIVAWNHGTYIWSTSAGEKSGSIYGPAYKASMVLCKTEDVRSETPVEEDNWVAALEYVDSIGVDVISSSLGYVDWYTYPDFDGATATTTLAANTAAALGIVHCNSMGNDGPNPGTLTAPADAFDILSVGSVTSLGGVSGFSSRGPTFDGRIKPEVVARGSSTFAANAAGGTTSYASPSGTSLSTPLVAGVVCLLRGARPGFTPLQIRQALMQTASNAATPDNNIGWGIVNIEKALDWGLDVAADTNNGNAPLAVDFTATSPLTPTGYLWNFGDGGTSTQQNPTYIYANGGLFTVTCLITTPYGNLLDTVSTPINVQQNMLHIETDSAYAGHSGTLTLSLSTTAVLNELTVPLLLDSALSVVIQSMTPAANTALMDSAAFLVKDTAAGEYVLRFAKGAGTALPIGTYPLVDLTYSIAPLEFGGRSNVVNSVDVDGFQLLGQGPLGPSSPEVSDGEAISRWIKRGNADNSADLSIDIGDLTFLVDHLFITFLQPITIQSGDCNKDLSIDIGDLTKMVDFLFLGGEAFPTP